MTGKYCSGTLEQHFSSTSLALRCLCSPPEIPSTGGDEDPQVHLGAAQGLTPAQPRHGDAAASAALMSPKSAAPSLLGGNAKAHGHSP